MKRYLQRLSFVLIAALAGSVHAAVVNYPGVRLGDHVEYFDISEDSGTDPTPLYEQRPGGPTISGDTLVFQPTAQFSSSAPTATQMADTTDGLLTFTVRAREGFYLDVISIHESGDYSLLALDGAMAVVQVTGYLLDFDAPERSADLIAQTVNPPVTAPPFFITAPPAGVASQSGGWVGTAALDLSAFQLTEVTIRLNNTLQSGVTDGGSAFIAKKQFSIHTSTTPVPEPASLALLSAGSLLLLARSRRRGGVSA